GLELPSWRLQLRLPRWLGAVPQGLDRLVAVEPRPRWGADPEWLDPGRSVAPLRPGPARQGGRLSGPLQPPPWRGHHLGQLLMRGVDVGGYSLRFSKPAWLPSRQRMMEHGRWLLAVRPGRLDQAARGAQWGERAGVWPWRREGGDATTRAGTVPGRAEDQAGTPPRRIESSSTESSWL